jgi:hypothetical protein
LWRSPKYAWLSAVLQNERKELDKAIEMTNNFLFGYGLLFDEELDRRLIDLLRRLWKNDWLDEEDRRKVETVSDGISRI